MCACVCVCACVCACVRACVRACVHVCVTWGAAAQDIQASGALGEGAFVYVNFNSVQKIEPALFAAWQANHIYIYIYI